ncbi:MAG: FtsH protease activity modulator HflK [Methylophilaceae bacterium]|nr:FtsH protease activity modulator HflK [Methylophilaceae bacterium]MBL6726362.1 FtsH protease activity modulator HflK [Methylophilaceae bacterium]MBL6729211.1 FtsH protease activity modulator HflK [Methylophilaceae bacterium]MBL6791549.1 FtsH protease activity modulator HflK [Methylophilaceae bacterium]
MFKYFTNFSRKIMAANQDGPPDLDELFKDLKNKMNRVIGGQRSGRGGDNGQTPNKSGPQLSGDSLPIGPIILIIILIWLATGFYIVDQGSRGVVFTFGKNTAVTMPGPRWHIPYPIETVEVVNLEQVRTIELGYRSSGAGATSQELRESLMLTGDENIIDLQFAVQYNLKSVQDFLFYNRSAENSVRGAAETSIREIVGKSEMDFVLYEGREEIAVKTRALMQDILDRYQTGINITSVTMQNAQPPEQVQAAFDDAVKAKQDQERQKNEGQAYANDVVPKARGSASRLIAQANGYRVSVENEALGNSSRFEQIMTEYNRAPNVTKQRLFLEAQENIMSSITKIIVDQKESNSLLYLPLDKIIQQSGATRNNQSEDAMNNNQQMNITSSKTSDAINSIADRARDALRFRDREPR